MRATAERWLGAYRHPHLETKSQENHHVYLAITTQVSVNHLDLCRDCLEVNSAEYWLHPMYSRVLGVFISRDDARQFILRTIANNVIERNDATPICLFSTQYPSLTEIVTVDSLADSLAVLGGIVS